MTMIAADTWGIPGPTFATSYLVLFLVVWIAVYRVRSRLFSRPAVPGSSLTSVELAYLEHGGTLAVAASLGQLRAAGVLDEQARPVGTSVSKDPVDTAVLTALRDAVDRPAARHVAILVNDLGVWAALADLSAGLQARGLIRTPAELTRTRLWSIPLWATVVLGIVRAIAGASNGKPVGYVLIVAGATACVALHASMPSTIKPLVAANRAIWDARKTHEHLSPRLKPSWTTYGAAGAGMSIALFGASSLLLAEPAFAETVAAQQLIVVPSSSVASGSSGGGCGGGGGGCGGGCGG